MMLWPLFGSLNQLPAALSVGVVTIYMRIRGLNILSAFIPMLIMLVITVWAMVENLVHFIDRGDRLLIVLSLLILGLTTWLMISSVISLFREKSPVLAGR